MYKGELKVGDKVKGTSMPSKYKFVEYVSGNHARVKSADGGAWSIDRHRKGSYWGSDCYTGHLTLVKPDKKAKTVKVKAEKTVAAPKVSFITISPESDFFFGLRSTSPNTFQTKEELEKWLNVRGSIKGVKVYQVLNELEVKGNFELVLK